MIEETPSYPSLSFESWSVLKKSRRAATDDYPVGDITSNSAVGSNYAPIANRHSSYDDSMGSDPDILADINRLVSSPLFSYWQIWEFEIVVCICYETGGCDECVVPDAHRKI